MSVQSCSTGPKYVNLPEQEKLSEIVVKPSIKERLDSFARCIFCCCCETDETRLLTALKQENINSTNYYLNRNVTTWIMKSEIIELAENNKFKSINIIMQRTFNFGNSFDSMHNAIFQLRKNNPSLYKKILIMYISQNYNDCGNYDFIIDLVRRGLVQNRPDHIPYDKKRVDRLKIFGDHLLLLLNLNYENLKTLHNKGYTYQDIAVVNGVCPIMQIIQEPISEDRKSCLSLLLDKMGAAINGKNPKKFTDTPLGAAVENGKAEFVRILLERSADPHLMAVLWGSVYDESGNWTLNVYNNCSPFQRALILGNPKVLEEFLPYVERDFQTLIQSKLDCAKIQQKLREVKRD